MGMRLAKGVERCRQPHGLLSFIARDSLIRQQIRGDLLWHNATGFCPVLVAYIPNIHLQSVSYVTKTYSKSQKAPQMRYARITEYVLSLFRHTFVRSFNNTCFTVLYVEHNYDLPRYYVLQGVTSLQLHIRYTDNISTQRHEAL
jgi:hypothetical protein